MSEGSNPWDQRAPTPEYDDRLNIGVSYRDAAQRDFKYCGSPWVFGAFWVLIFIGCLMVNGAWAGFHGVLLACAGMLMWFRVPIVSVPRAWWILGGVFVLAGSAAFLPAGWFMMPGWRGELEALGVSTGPMVAIQSLQAAEGAMMFAVMLFTGLWLAGHRPTPSQLRLWAMAFTLGVAAFAILAKLMQDMPVPGQSAGGGQFGFFPNRNHTATYLAMGTVCGFGNLLQALRDRRPLALAAALAATGVCLWALAGWSVSRGGLLLAALGCSAWLAVLGRRYVGKSGRWAIGLIVFAVVGLFFISESHLKDRLAATMGKAGVVLETTAAASPAGGKSVVDSPGDLDFRIPTALDSLALIRDFKWTGVGAGQFSAIFPQYRNRSASANDADHLHPESDWLWMAAEAGIPATLALFALVLLAAWKSLRGILRGRDRALRAGCLVAALLVPFHGLFDVPGHRITLAWSAAFLFSLSLPPILEGGGKAPPKAWPFRCAALVLIAAAAFLCAAQWWGGHQPASLAGPLACEKAHALYQDDLTIQQAAGRTGGHAIEPSGEDRLEQALAVLEHASKVAPLDRRLRHLQGFIGLHFEDLDAQSSRAFAIERRLDPTWVNGPMRQALAWSRTSPSQTAFLWREALGRADWMDLHHPGSRWSRDSMIAEMRRSASGHVELESLLENVADKGE